MKVLQSKIYVFKKFIPIFLALLIVFSGVKTVGADEAYSDTVSVKFLTSPVGGGLLSSNSVSVKFGISPVGGGLLPSNSVSVKFVTSPIGGGLLSSNSVSVRFKIVQTGRVGGAGALSAVFNTPRGLWHMDDNWQDSSGYNLHGTPGGNAAFIENGMSNQAGTFDGTNSYVNMGSSNLLRPSVFLSVAAWVWVDPSASGNMFIAGNINEGAKTGYGLTVNNGAAQFKVGNGSVWETVTSNTQITPGVWTHIAGTYDKEDLKIYVNGVEVGQEGAYLIINHTNPFRVGYTGTTNPGYFSGVIDEVAVYARALRAEEVAGLLGAAGVDIVPPTTPVVNPIDSPTSVADVVLTGTKEADSSVWISGAQVVPVNGDETWQATYTLHEGENTLTVTSRDEAGNESESISFIVVLDNTSPTVLNTSPVDGDNLNTVIESVVFVLEDVFGVDLVASTQGATVTNSSSQAVSGDWTTSGLDTVIFTPESAFLEDTFIATINPTDSIGNSATASITFTYDATAPSAPTIDSVPSVIKSESYTVTGTKSEDSVTTNLNASSGTVGTVTYPTATSWSVSVTGLGEGLNTITVTGKDAAGNESGEVMAAIEVNTLIALYHMDGDWTDSSGNENHGVSYNGVTFTTDSRVGSHAGSFDGVNDVVLINPFTNFPSKEISVGFWMKSSNTSRFGTPFSYAVSAVDNEFLVFDYRSFRIYIASSHSYVATGVSANDGSWHHIVVTWRSDDGQLKLYKDGVVVYTGTKAKGHILRQGGSLAIGQEQDSVGGVFDASQAFRGTIDEVTIYGRALSAEVVLSHYEDGLRDFAPPVVTSTLPVDGVSLSDVVNSVSFNLDDPTGIDLNATLNGASVTDSSGQSVVGTWTTLGTDTVVFTPLSAFVEDTYTVTINPTDSIGNSSVASITFTYDVTAPALPTIDQVTSPTNASTQDVTGSKSVDGLITVTTDGAAVAGQVVYPTDTTWSVSVTGFGEGDNTITIYAEDEAGNRSEGVLTLITLDTTAPAAPTVGSVTSPTSINTQTLSGTKDADSSVIINGSEIITLNASTTWEAEVNLSSGENIYSVVSRDSVGNESQAVEAAIILDNQAPVISSSTPISDSYTPESGVITVNLSDVYSDVNLAASLAGAMVKSGSDEISGTWNISGNQVVFTPDASFADGSYTVTLYPVDALGNSGTVSLSFILDTTAPVVDSLTTDKVSPYDAGSVTFTLIFNENMSQTEEPLVRFENNSTYDLTGGWISAKAWRGTYEFTSATGDGTYTVTASGATDLAGNVLASQDLSSFVIDTEAPVAPTVDSVTTPTKTPTQTITGIKQTGTAIVINGSVKVALNSDTPWSYVYPLTEGDNTLTITARDGAGNDSTPVAASINLDTTPAVFIVTDYQNPSNVQTQAISGTKEPGITVTLNGSTIIEPTDMNTDWSYDVTLTEGITNRLIFMASDAMGNSRTRIIDILYDESAPQPLATGVLVADGSGSGTTAALSWSAYQQSPDVGYYRVYYSTTDFTDSSALTPVATVNAGTTSFTVTGLTEGVTYYFAVVPVDGSGNSDINVNTANAATIDTAAPEDVTGLSAAADHNTIDGNFITLNWTASVDTKGDLTDQTVYFDDGSGYDGGTTLGSTDVTYTKTGLSDNTVYKFKVTTKDSAGHESAGRVATGVTRLPNPQNVTAEPGKAKVVLTWSAPATTLGSYIDRYNVYRLESLNQQTDVATMTLIASLTGLSFTDTGLTNGVMYQYAVTVTNTSGAETREVQSISARPRQDDTGPVISGINITDSQVLTEPVTVTASATDAESTVDRIDVYLNDAIVTTGSGSTVSSYWNVVEAADGNHTVKFMAYDALGNTTTLDVPVIVSLAPPGVPAITSHIEEATTPDYLVSISGTADLYTTVKLRVNGLVVAEATSAGDGSFSFTGVTLVEGDNLISAKAVHRGGESAFSPAYKIIVDTGAPDAPQNLVASALAGGTVEFTWEAGAGELPVGYNLYESSAVFTGTTDTGVTKINANPLNYLLSEQIPTDDVLRYYAVTAIDSSGNESPVSGVVSIASDRAPPSVSGVEYSYNGGSAASDITVGKGTIDVSFTVSEPLVETPFFSLEPETGSPIVMTLTKLDDLHYSGSFNVTASSPHGPTIFKFSGKDFIGNRGNQSGTGLTIDVRGPGATITSPVTLLQLTTSPVAVTVEFDEPPTGTPVLELHDAGAQASSVTWLASTDELHWSGTVDISSLNEGDATFVLTEARDALDNVSTTINSGDKILLYADAPPAPAVPVNLTALPEKGGGVVLSWDKITSAGSYKVYRRADADVSATFVASFAANSATDLSPVDGLYHYSVTSVGLLDSESARSDEASATSDRTAPPVPTGLTLSLGGDGINAVWTAVSEENVSYRLYHNSGVITDISSLTHVAATTATETVDTSPTTAKRFYAVTALDALGNESAPSETIEITFPVAPVSSLTLTLIDDGQPTLNWVGPDTTISGYYIYRNGSRINQTPTVSISFADGIYSSGTVTYGVSVVDNLGEESPIKIVTLPDLTIGLAEGTTLRRGALETVEVVLANNGTDLAVTLSSIDMTIGTAAKSTLAGPFTVDAGGSLTVGKVAATALDAQSTVPVVIKGKMNPSPGTVVNITKTVTASVIGSSTALEIFNEPLVRGGQAQVRLKVNNLGSALMEFLTSQNNGPTSHVTVNLRDQDGNLLATGNLDQRTGNVVNVGSYALARTNPGESFLSIPVSFTVPPSAPQRVIVEATIKNTYYHFNKPDQVVAPGMTVSFETNIVEVAYSANAVTDKQTYQQGEAVVITGSAVSTGTGDFAANVPVKLGVSVKGFDRFFEVTTAADGTFTHTFTPGANEAGTYSVWAVHPDVTDRTVQAQFNIVGLYISPSAYNVRLAKNRSINLSVTIENLGDTPLTGVKYTSELSDGVSVGVLNLGSSLRPGEKRSVTVVVTAAPDAPDSGFVRITISSTEGVTEDFNVNLTIVESIPIISPTPSYIDTGLLRGTQKIATFDIKNKGYETLKNARLEGPSTEWMSLTIDPNIGDIAPGASKTIGVFIRPGETVPQAVYDDRIVIYSDNHRPFTYNIQVTVTSDAVGSVLFDVLNEFYEDVPDAAITFQHQQIPELIYNIKSGADGTVLHFDIPEGRYVFNVTASNHVPYSGTFYVEPGLTSTVLIGLQVNLIDIEWSVTEITIEDRYEINVKQTFVTNVPAPVLIVEPAYVSVPELQPGQTFNGEFTVTNYGLIALYNMRMNLPTSFEDYDMEVMNELLPERLEAMQSITIPYRLTRRAQVQTVAFNNYSDDTGTMVACADVPDSMQRDDGITSDVNQSLPLSRHNALAGLFSEVRGYGDMCAWYEKIAISGVYEPCEGRGEATKSIEFIIRLTVLDCGGGSGATGGGPRDDRYAGAGPGSWIEGGLPGDAKLITPVECPTGGSSPSGGPACAGGSNGNKGGSSCKQCEPETSDTNSTVIYTNGTYTFDETDLSVSARGMDVNLRRTYRSNRILKTDSGSEFASPVNGPLGYGWTTPFFEKVINGNTFVDEDGRYFKFDKDSVGKFLPKSLAAMNLEGAPSGGFTLSKLDAYTRTFDFTGKLLTKSDNHGNTWTMEYDNEGKLVKVKDATDRDALVFTYNGGGRIATATDLAGRTASYEYDATGHLIKVTDAAGHAYTYTYNSNHGMTSKTNPLGETVSMIYKLPDKGVIGKVTGPDGNFKEFQYSFESDTFFITDYNGRQVKKTVNDKGLLTSSVDVSSGKTIKQVEHISGGIIKTTDELGNITEEQEDENGNLLRRVDPEGNEWSFTYTTGNRMTSKTYPDGRVDTFEYDEFGNKVKETLAKGSADELITVHVYDGFGQRVSTTRAGAIATFAYDSDGNLTSITDPLGNARTIEYDIAGNMTAVTGPEGSRVEYTYDALSNPITRKDALGNVTTLTYDAAGKLTSLKDPLDRITGLESDFDERPTAVTDALGNRIEFKYDAEDNLVKITQGDAVTTRAYDSSNRIISETDAEGNTTSYEYVTQAGCSSCGASLSMPVKETDPLGNIIEFTFDKNDRVTTSIDPLTNVIGFTYDTHSRVLSKTDANGNMTKFEYDLLGRVVMQTDANGGNLIANYDAIGNLDSLTDQEGNTTTYEYDLVGRVTKETRPMGQRTEYTYYKDGLVKTIKDAEGKVTGYAYDAAKRLTGITSADGNQHTLGYDAVGNMTEYVSGDVSSTMTYDALNRMLSETVDFGVFSKTYSYTYDARGNKATFTTPEGVTHSYAYNKVGQPTSLAFAGRTVGYEYEWNRLVKSTLPNGITTDYQYNKNSWLKFITTKQGTTTRSEYEYGFDRVGNVTAENSEAYTYDSLYRLSGVDNSLVADEAYTYDKAGNRTSSIETVGSWSYNANNELEGFNNNTVYTYDGNGNTTSRVSGGETTLYHYDSANRLRRVVLPDGTEVVYTYDLFNRRVSKDVGGEVTYYLYDTNDGLTGEYDSFGNLKKGYGWMGLKPVFMTNAAGAYFYYHNDHLATPQSMTNDSGVVVWSARYTAFGQAVVDVASTVENNLRFPGQYFDAETGLHYNINRYYDPQTGRYTQTDPIGFAAGDANLYRYVFNNPINLTDSSGEFALIFPVVGITVVTMVAIVAWHTYATSSAGKKANAAAASAAATAVTDFIRRCRGKWTCKATCHVVSIPEDRAPRKSITGPPMRGRSRSQACFNAKWVCMNTTPLDWRTKHCYCKPKDCTKI